MIPATNTTSSYSSSSFLLFRPGRKKGKTEERRKKEGGEVMLGIRLSQLTGPVITAGKITMKIVVIFYHSIPFHFNYISGRG